MAQFECARTTGVGAVDVGLIQSEVERLLSDKDYYNSMAHAINPYGDGKASERIINILIQNRNKIIASEDG